MKKIFLLILILFMFSCDNDDSVRNDDYSKLIGKWIMYEQETEDAPKKLKKDYSEYYNPVFDNYRAAEFKEFTEDEMYFYEHNEFDPSEYSDVYDYELENGKIVYGYFESEYDYEFDGSDLIIIDKWIYNGVLESTETTRYRKYSGDFPPESWVVEYLDDSYESDDTYQTATSLAIDGEWQSHSAIEGNEDWFSFSAVAGKRYLIRVNNISGDQIVSLYGTDGTTYLDEDDDDDSSHFSEDEHAESALVWPCSTSGTYYFKVKNYNDSYSNYYAVSLDETTIGLSKNRKTEKRTK